MVEILPGSLFPTPKHPNVRVLEKLQRCDVCGYDNKKAAPGAFWHFCNAPDVKTNELGISYDVADAPIVDAHRWWIDSKGYPTASIDGSAVRMHIFLMGARPRLMVDHISTNKLDNRRANLRWVTNQQNLQNRAGVRSNSGFRGVSFVKRVGKFYVQHRLNYKKFSFGPFDTAEAAGRAACAWRTEHMVGYVCRCPWSVAS